MRVVGVAASLVLAVLGAFVGYLGWLALMWLFATVCQGAMNIFFCAGMGGPNMFDLLTLPFLVIGGAVLGWGLGASLTEREDQ